MFIKKRGKAKAKADAAAAVSKDDVNSGAGGGGAASSQAFITNEDDFDHRLGNYQLMEPIGKGGYGTVYRGLNIERGMTVAVKRVNLQGIPHDELESIEMEIRLLQNLAHPNIVKYLDSIRSDDFLNIILEYVENGSLSSLLVKFGGMFPEQLCAHYITQVLKGLHYLHTQGVIHRDIKGANILSTKEGQVKLADFGVATKLNESRKSDSVVGTPYWMAPEIIEMTGQQSSACDIWSVGCTCVELLTGKPPYFDLQQMPALFRIVQDEHPPLPDGISPALEDFLMQCFQKDPNRRIDAPGLLKHPWLKKSVEMQEVEEMKRKMLEDQSIGGAGSSSVKHGRHPSQSEESEWDEEDEQLAPPRKSGGSHVTMKSSSKLPKVKKNGGMKHVGSDNEDDWDAAAEGLDEMDEGEEPIPIQPKSSKLSSKNSNKSTMAFPKDTPRIPAISAARQKKQIDDEGELTIKLRSPIDSDVDPFAEFSDEEEKEPEEDEDAEEVVDKTSMKTIRPMPHITAAALVQKKNHQLSPQQIPSISSTNSSITPSSQPLNSTNPSSSSASSTLTSSFSLGAAPVGSSIGSGPKLLESFVENDEDELGDYTELEADLEVKAAVPADHHLHTKLNNFTTANALTNSNSSAGHHAGGTDHGDDLDGLDDEEADPFDDITFDDGDNAAEDVLLNKAYTKILEQFYPSNDASAVLHACEQLNELGQKNPEQIRNFMTNHGVIPIMEMLEVQNTHILHAVLKVVNQIVGKNVKFQQNMSLVGLIPAIIRFGGSNFPTEIRMESASFVRQFCYATDWTRKMFIACDGLPVLVSFLHEDYHSCKTLVWNAIDCIRHVFDINTSPKNDFCRLFCKFGLLEPLSKTLIAIQSDKESADAPEYVLKIAKILHLFSQGDKVVKLHFAKPAVLESMLKVLPELPQDILILILKSIRNISMDDKTLDLLEVAGAIPALIPFLDVSQVSENQHQVLLTMYSMCQLKSSRQEQAALSGIIPHLQRFIRQDHPLKQFAYPIILGLARASWRTRAELKKHGGLQFYIDILVSADVYWRSYALEVVAFWLSSSPEDSARVSFILNTSSNLNKLLRVFRETTDEAQFDKIGNGMRKVLASSSSVNQSMGRIREFIKEIKIRLDRHTSSLIRLNLLRILGMMVSTQTVQLITDCDGLSELINKLVEEKSAVMVSDMARSVLEKLKKNPVSPNPLTANSITVQ